MMGRIDVNYQLCMGCGICENVCSSNNEGQFRPAVARIHIERFHPGPIDVPVVCHQCSDAPCVEACPLGGSAIHKDASGVVRIDEDSCLGCGLCIDACPHGAIRKHPDSGLPLVCDLCDGDPECVKACPMEALRYFMDSQLDGKHYAFFKPSEIAASIAGKYSSQPPAGRGNSDA